MAIMHETTVNVELETTLDQFNEQEFKSQLAADLDVSIERISILEVVSASVLVRYKVMSPTAEEASNIEGQVRQMHTDNMMGGQPIVQSSDMTMNTQRIVVAAPPPPSDLDDEPELRASSDNNGGLIGGMVVLALVLVILAFFICLRRPMDHVRLWVSHSNPAMKMGIYLPKDRRDALRAELGDRPFRFQQAPAAKPQTEPPSAPVGPAAESAPEEKAAEAATEKI